MSAIRQVAAPTVIATPLWLCGLSVFFRGWDALSDLSLRIGDLVFGMIFTLLGLLFVGLPAASFARRLKSSVVAKTGLLLITGVAGGALVAFVYFLGLAVMGAGLDAQAFAGLLVLASVGCLPGFIVASVWIVINFDKLRQPTRGAFHG